jgi:hypothetical protein
LERLSIRFPSSNTGALIEPRVNRGVAMAARVFFRVTRWCADKAQGESVCVISAPPRGWETRVGGRMSPGLHPRLYQRAGVGAGKRTLAAHLPRASPGAIAARPRWGWETRVVPRHLPRPSPWAPSARPRWGWETRVGRVSLQCDLWHRTGKGFRLSRGCRSAVFAGEAKTRRTTVCRSSPVGP